MEQTTLLYCIIALMYISGVITMYHVLTNEGSTTLSEWLLVPVWFLATPCIQIFVLFAKLFRSKFVKNLKKKYFSNEKKSDLDVLIFSIIAAIVLLFIIITK